MKFKCNFCERTISHQHFGAPKIKCYCGATYTKVVSVEITADDPSKKP